MQHPVDERHGAGLVGQETPPLVEGRVAGDAQAAALLGGSEEAEEQRSASGVERHEADLVEQDEIGAEQAVDAATDHLSKA